MNDGWITDESIEDPTPLAFRALFYSKFQYVKIDKGKLKSVEFYYLITKCRYISGYSHVRPI